MAARKFEWPEDSDLLNVTANAISDDEAYGFRREN